MKRPYHHGDLPAALLVAAEQILAEQGVDGLSLRAVARRVGVSHMAPTPHFGDLAGLLSELAAVGYRRFAQSLAAARDRPGPYPPAAAVAHAYVRFARDYPQLFLLMFRSSRLDFSRPSLAAASAFAAAQLPGGNEIDHLGSAILGWSLVHGFAMLLLDGRLDQALATPAVGGDPDTLLDAALRAGFA